jgi:hypothetical protein
MGQAEEARPISYLDQAIIRVALVEARRLIAAGKLPDEAAGLACTGAWSPLRGQVRARLSVDRDRG